MLVQTFFGNSVTTSVEIPVDSNEYKAVFDTLFTWYNSSLFDQIFKGEQAQTATDNQNYLQVFRKVYGEGLHREPLKCYMSFIGTPDDVIYTVLYKCVLKM